MCLVARTPHPSDGRARTVAVVLKNDGAVLELSIRDNGAGFDAPAALRAGSGLGLHSMQERAALLGGTVEIDSAPGHGTTIRARIPTSLGATP